MDPYYDQQNGSRLQVLHEKYVHRKNHRKSAKSVPLLNKVADLQPACELFKKGFSTGVFF